MKNYLGWRLIFVKRFTGSLCKISSHKFTFSRFLQNTCIDYVYKYQHKKFKKNPNISKYMYLNMLYILPSRQSLIPWPYTEIFINVNLRHAQNKTWACAESEFRFCWKILCNNDDHCNMITKMLLRALFLERQSVECSLVCDNILSYSLHEICDSAGFLWRKFFCITSGRLRLLILILGEYELVKTRSLAYFMQQFV